MANTQSIAAANGRTLLGLLHDRAAQFITRVDLELLAFQLTGAVVLLEMIFSLGSVW